MLQEIGEGPKQIASRGVSATEAFSCALCGACEAVCPVQLSPQSLFAAGRRQANSDGDISMGEYAYLRPDRTYNLMRVYRDYYGIDYGDIELTGTAASCFFPGCTLMTYAPELTRSVYAKLQSACGCAGLIGDCCGKPLSLLGLPAEKDRAAERLREKLQRHKIRDVVLACPGCYYELREQLAAANIRVRTVYEALAGIAGGPVKQGIYTVHDSCPDRVEGIFGRQVRAWLQSRNLSLVEMEHHRKHSLCCGSGGMLSRFRPDMTERMVSRRVGEAAAAGAETIVSYCLSCAMKFADAPDAVRSRHALSLLFGRDDDFSGVRGKAAAMLAGPQGEELWAKMLAD